MDVSNYCIVGYGNHAETKLIPALKNTNKQIFAIVSSKKLLFQQNCKVFSNLDEALDKSSKETIFIISTPPQAHFNQIKTILCSKRSVFVEKPIFTGSKDVLFIQNMLSKGGLFVAEALMYKHTILYTKFIDYWNKNKINILKLECNFLIPSIPSNTFRDGFSISSSPLYDIGCYIISLLIDLNFQLDNLKIEEIFFKDSKIEKILINNTSEKIEILLNFGLNKEYKNSIKLFSSKNSVEFSPFFYGRQEKKKILYEANKNKKEIVIDDCNAFENMFNISKNNWLSNQEKRFINILKVNIVLESLSDQVENFKSIN